MFVSASVGGFVSRDGLGLFDTPPNRQQIRFSVAILGLLLAYLIVVLTMRDVRLGQIDVFIPMIDAVTSLVDLIVATLLYVQATVFRSRALSILASGFVYTALILIPHMLTFPGAFAPGGLLGAGTSTTAWIYIFWRAGIPIAVTLYVLTNRTTFLPQPGSERPLAMIAAGAFAAFALAIAVTLLTTSAQDLLPQLYLNRSVPSSTHFNIANSVLIALAVTAMGTLLIRRRSVLNMWLFVVLSAWLVQTVLLMCTHGRFTVSWYGTVVIVLFSQLFLMLGLLAESSRLYARLAVSIMAQKREREARLMSMDAVAAAIAHEIRQPLAAMVTNAGAVLRWLDRTPIDPAAVAKPANAIIDEGHRASDVIESIRLVLAKRTGERTRFSLNELVRETASELGRELGSAQVSLQLALSEALTPIMADRVQLQQVLVNIFTNAIEALGAIQGRVRQLTIRTVPLGEEVLLEVSDNGTGIKVEQMEHIFDYFFTTKATGTGIGLALCRTIVEEHGGHLWASQGEQHGAIFHMQLPLRGSPAYGDIEL
jgi:signal transduction histidine kinase